MNNSLYNKLRLQQANKLYEDRVNNFTQLELILKSYSKSRDFLELAIEANENNDLKNFRKHTSNAIILIQNMLFNLNFTDNNGNRLIVAENLHAMYTFILEVLRDGLRNNSCKDFNHCIAYITTLHDAFKEANS